MKYYIIAKIDDAKSVPEFYGKVIRGNYRIFRFLTRESAEAAISTLRDREDAKKFRVLLADINSIRIIEEFYAVINSVIMEQL